MAYLYLNFIDNMEVGLGSKAWGRDDFYTSSLSKQYEEIKRKLGGYAPNTLQQFIEAVFPQNISKEYNISMPSFDRQLQIITQKNGRTSERIFNIVIRPEKDSYINSALPDNYDVMIIGDLTYGGVVEITVKGIELIDSNVAKFGEKRIKCKAACAFTKKTFMVSGREITVPDYLIRETHDEVLTNDFIVDLCDNVFPVPNKLESKQVLSQWEKYIQFRKYYLGKQSERCEAIGNVEVKNAFIITKEAYRRDEERISQYLLDGVQQFAKGEQIILNRNVEGSESFPLICVSIQRLRKDVFAETIGKDGKGKPKFEVYLQRYTKEAMGLSKDAPRYDENGNYQKGFRFNQYLLGERYLFATVDIEPDLMALDKQYEKNYSVACSTIDSKYAGIINNELSKYIEVQSPIIKRKYDERFTTYIKELNDNLEKDINQNLDKEIKKAIEAEIARQSVPFNSTRKKDLDDIRSQIDKAKKEIHSKDELSKKLEELRAKEEMANNIYYKKLEEIKASINIRNYYVNRNKEWIAKKEKSLAISYQTEVTEIKKEKKSQLEVQYRNSKDEEKVKAKENLQQQLIKDKANKIEKETIREYRIYFRPNDNNDSVNEIEKAINIIEPAYLVYDNRAEKAKIERQEKALASISGGYVKNPFLPTYLFAPTELKQISRVSEKDPDWCLESLNEGQKLAVKRALASESIFLLQGPPGTGKTQVIAEITAQLCKQGKKVLISSETHKAIDNVFERLPKIPEIRPLRLIPSQNAKETNYSPEKLVDNFYANIRGNLDREVNRFEHFEENKLTFNEKMKELRIKYEKLLKLQRDNVKIDKEREERLSAINKLTQQLETQRYSLSQVKDLIEQYRRTQRQIESYRFSLEGTVEKFINEYKTDVESMLRSFACLKDIPLEKIGELVNVNIDEIKEELSSILSEEVLVGLKSRQTEIRNKMQDLRDPDTDEAPQEGDSNYQLYKDLQNKLINIGKEIKEAQSATAFDVSDSKVIALAPSIINNKELLKRFPNDLTAFRIILRNKTMDFTAKIEEFIAPHVKNEGEISEKIADIQIKINESKKTYEELGNNEGVAEYSELSSTLKQDITRFFHDFNIIKEYNSDNLETAFDIIREEWNKIEFDYKRTTEENASKIPMYKDIIKYLSQEDILEEDRQSYTRELYNCANVFGITCTSRDRFTPNQLQELGKYGISSVDIKQQGIDVVIVDEVSKSSFLDLLIPILYGKTIILVGDHRQLPPMYDLRHLRRDDFEGLDEDIITKEINDKYTELYEECFFKTLYENVPDDFRVMLTKQYRCHSHIMEVFNHFYGGNGKGLTIGKKQQDDEKEHGLTVRINGQTIIEPKFHVYFIDCDQKESSAYEGSTSKINNQEADVAMTLLKEINNAVGNLIKNKKVRVDKEGKVDERPSIGVICTYGDQAGLIKKKRKYQKFDNFSEKSDEKLIISTVDDFQGDERDIIILSMVRNPAGNRYDAEFIKKFERINVALSRARKLLIVVGSKKFLSEAGVIDLPDLTGNHSQDKVNYHVYEEIINTIRLRGRLLIASDIIGD
ncbi:MAG: AAA family ATPase [Clostridia bacterium]|nr:AAA family ATPase [Clostridia bacterium]